MSNFPFPGLNLALTTPFDATGRIDWDRLETLIERYLGSGVRGFVLSSGTGMHVYLSKEESMELARRGSKIIKAAPGSSCRHLRSSPRKWLSAPSMQPIAVQTASWCCPRFSRGPPTTTTSSRSIQRFPMVAFRLSATTCPRQWASKLLRASFRCSARVPNFCTVKDSSGDLGKQASLIRTGLPVMNGADPLVPYALYAGASGLIWGGANIAPKTCLAIVEAARAQDWRVVRKPGRLSRPSCR